jgi:flagellar motility protein MotE (MotC chaperone)
MKANLFSPILILLIVTLFLKASVLFGRIQEQTSYSVDTNTSSILVETAYATSNSKPKKKGVNSEIQKKLTPKKISVKKRIRGRNLIDNMSRSEIELLKELSKRRKKLDSEQKQIKEREQVLKATENKLDKKVVELKQLQARLESLVKEYDKKEHKKILSLVKIYETMKPKDAAKIFNKLEMPVLLRVVSNMKEVKVAPIIASMDPNRAREISIELARQKPLD